MTRAWIAVALLAGSWLLGLDYFQPHRYSAWAAFLACASVLLAQPLIVWPSRRQMALAIIPLAPAAYLAPAPYNAAPWMLAAGLLAQWAPAPRRWARLLGQGAATAGAVLLVQSLALMAYTSLTARNHQLPWELSQLVTWIVRLLGVEAVEDCGTIAMGALQRTTQLAAAWEFLLDPATVCFFVGAVALLGLVACSSSSPVERWRLWRRGALGLAVATLAWAPIRVAILTALVLQRELRADAITAPNVGSVLVNSTVHILLLAGLVLFVLRLVPNPSLAPEHAGCGGAAVEGLRVRRRARAASPFAMALGVACLVVFLYWTPSGERKSGRVMIVERHSTWEPTTTPYGTAVYGEAGSYNYAAMYAYCSQYYQMSRLLEKDAIDDARLGGCDVLVIKTPTSRYGEQEAAAIVRFVERGGSLLLIGDHTNVFNMNTSLNDIARRFGFSFRNDLLFKIGTPYSQEYRPPLLRRPMLQGLPPMHFAVSCSIDPGWSAGAMAIRNSGLWSLPPAYQESNYHPQAEYRPIMQYGAWCQLWSASYGQGRVLAFGDSTLFSNFCTYQPGKIELLMGMLEWLNHHGQPRGLAAVLWAIAGAIGVVWGLWLGRPTGGAWVLLVSAGFAGWAAGASAMILLSRTALPAPPILRPMTHVVIDRNLSEVPLFTGAFADDEDGAGYGMLEQWIPRIGNFISRGAGDKTFVGDGLVILCPTRSVSQQYQDQLLRYVESGGKVLVVDAAAVEGSTANSLLWPFGLASNHSASPAPKGKLRCVVEAPEIPLEASCEITGGKPLAWLGETPVAASARYGNGTVTAIGFGDLFNDASMGLHWLPEPDAETRQRYDVLYALLRASLPAQPLAGRRR